MFRKKGRNLLQKEESVIRHAKKLEKIASFFNRKGIAVSVFVDPDKEEIRAALYAGISTIEIHTGQYSIAKTKREAGEEFRKIKESAEYALSEGLVVNVGHGLNYENTGRIADIKGINELNIGHSIISRAVFAGLYKAVKDMKSKIASYD